MATKNETAEQALLRQIALLAGQINRQKQIESSQHFTRSSSSSFPSNKTYIPPPSLLRSNSLSAAPSTKLSSSVPSSRSIYSINTKNPVNNAQKVQPVQIRPSFSPFKKFNPRHSIYSKFNARNSKYSLSNKETKPASPAKLRWSKEDFRIVKKEEKSGTVLSPPSASKRIVINRGIKQNKYKLQNSSLLTPRKTLLNKKLDVIRQKNKERQKPQCSFFLRGVCTNKDCKYSHVYISPTAPVCKDFRNGFCPNGNLCKMKHPMVCPEFEATGKCDNPRTCKLKHKRSSNSQSLYSTRKTKEEEEDEEDEEEDQEPEVQVHHPSISSTSLLPHFDDSFTSP